MSKPGNIWRKVHGKIAKKPTNFSWLIEERLAGSGIPTSLDEFDWLLNQGVKSIVTMTENALPGEWTQKIDYLHVPTADFHAPDMEGIDSAAGLGRAGTILACYFIKYKKLTAIQAIQKIRDERPGSIQSDVQELAISYYEKYVRN